MSIKYFKSFFVVIVGFFLIFNLSSCGKREKDIVISEDVKEEFKKQDQKSLTISKINDLNTEYKNYEPLCWRDDENFVAIDVYNKVKNYDVYNINIKTSKATKVDTIKGTVYLAPQIKDKKIIYSKDYKLWVYDLIDNKSKKIWDLTEAKDEINKYGACINFVKGTGYKYVSIVTIKKQGKEEFKNIRMLDTSTGKITKSKDMKIPLFNEFIYNKEKDSFYTTDSQYIYEYKLDNPNEIKKVKNTSKGYIGYDFANVSSDGKYIYSIVSNDRDNKENRIIRYDVANNKFTNLLDEKGSYSWLSINKNTNNVAYTYDDLEGKTFYNCIGKIKGDKIKEIKRIPLENEKKFEYYHGDIMMNEKGDKFIYRTIFKKDKDKRGTILKAYNIKN